MTLIGASDQVGALVRPTWPSPATSGISQLAAAVVAAAVTWANEADTLANLMGWAPSESNDLGRATLRLLDAVHTLEAQAACPSGGEPAS